MIRTPIKQLYNNSDDRIPGVAGEDVDAPSPSAAKQFLHRYDNRRDQKHLEPYWHGRWGQAKDICHVEPEHVPRTRPCKITFEVQAALSHCPTQASDRESEWVITS